MSDPTGESTGERDARLAQRFVSVADTLVDDFDLVDLLDQLVQSCVDLLGVTAAGLHIVDDSGELRPLAESTEAFASTEFTAVHELPMRIRGETIGSLNLSTDGREPLTEAELEIAQALAHLATIGIVQQRSLRRATALTEQLRGALDTRIGIEQAKGVLAEYGGVDMARAFTALRCYARGNNLKLSEVAQSLVRGHIDPGVIIRRRS